MKWLFAWLVVTLPTVHQASGITVPSGSQLRGLPCPAAPRDGAQRPPPLPWTSGSAFPGAEVVHLEMCLLPLTTALGPFSFHSMSEKETKNSLGGVHKIYSLWRHQVGSCEKSHLGYAGPIRAPSWHLWDALPASSSTQLGPSKSTHGIFLLWFYHDNLQCTSFLYNITAPGYEQFHRIYCNCLTRLPSLDMQLVSTFMQHN